MKIFMLTGGLLLALAAPARAGCIGPVIMGECHGSQTPWDTHMDGRIRQDAPPGFYYDKRGTNHEQEHRGDVNPFTGRDAHDSNWGLQQPFSFDDGL